MNSEQLIGSLIRQLTGQLDGQLDDQSATHLREIFPGYFLHEQVIEPYRALLKLAAEAGLELRLASAFRSFDRQLVIWNDKASGARPVFDDGGKPIALGDLSDIDKVRAILRWSALPGASRHHWGTDMDVWDAGAVSGDYQLQLAPEEYASGGVFHRLSRWLDDFIDNDHSVDNKDSGFYRPYGSRSKDWHGGGVAPEPWHISYRPVAERYQRSMTQALLQNVLENTDILFKQTILDNLDEIYRRFVQVEH